MEPLINQITAQPLIMVVLVILAIGIVYTLIKKLVKLAFTAVVLALIVLGYVWFTSDQPEKDVKNLIEKSTETIKEAGENTKELKEAAQKKIEELKEKLPESIDKK